MNRYRKAELWACLLCALLILPAIIHCAKAEVNFYYFDPDSLQYNLRILKKEMDHVLDDYEPTITFQPFSHFRDFDQQTHKSTPSILFVPDWYMQEFGQALRLKPWLRAVRDGEISYKKQLIRNKRQSLSQSQPGIRAMAMTTLGPNGKQYIERILSKRWNQKPGTLLSVIEVPKDTDAIFAVALGQVDAALVAVENLRQVQNINPNLTALVNPVAESDPLNLPMLVYNEDTLSVNERELFLKLFIEESTKSSKQLLKILRIDAWRPIHD